MMKRRNVESTKNRKQFHFRKCRFAEGMVGSNTFLYLKFLLMWILIMAADYLLEFRFEFLWPFWLLIRSLHDSFKYQGILFSFFFALVAFLSDLLFYTFLPVQWLFFAASTYVWVQYVWHTEKGICLPTVTLWLLFVYIEASLRLKTVRTVDLCRPFAAHCIGYPMVTLGFGFKSYLSYKLRLKKQKEIQKQNEFHMQLIAKALPVDLQIKDKEKFKSINYNNEEQTSSQQAVSSSSTPTSILRTLYNFAISITPLNSNNNSNSTTSQNTPIPVYGSSNNTSGNNSTASGTKEKHSTSKKEAFGSGGSGLIASALSFYLNNNTSNVNNTNHSEEAPYIQQKDNANQRKNSNKYNSNNNSSDSSVEYINPKNSGDYFNAKKANSGAGTDQENSVNFNLSSISIQSLAQHTQSMHSSSNANGGTNHLANGNFNPLNGNLVLLSNPKIEENLDNDTDTAHQRSSSTSSNNSAFKTNNSQHTNININMTINATAIAAATANSPKTTTSSTGTGTSTKSRSKNKDTNSLHPLSQGNKQQRANSVASSTSSSSSLSSTSSLSGSTATKTSSKALKNDSGQFSFKDDLISRLEADLKKLREENEQQKTVEQYLRNQITYVTKCDRSDKLKFEKLEKENKSLQSKVNKSSTQSQKDKDELEACEKRLEDEKRARDKLESQLAVERKHREGQDLQVAELKKKLSDAVSKSLKASQAVVAQQQQVCTGDSRCGKRLRELEAENVKMGAELRKKQDRVLMLECELKSVSRSRDTESRVDTLMAALNLMEDKNASLQESLSAETRFKLDLFSALGEARRQLESCNFQLKSKERELNAFKTIFKQTLSASGNTSFTNSNILNSYLNGTPNSSESSSPSSTQQEQSKESHTSKGETSHQTTSSLNDWSNASTNSMSAFLPKI